MKPSYRCVEGAFVAENPQKNGVVEFYGGALFEILPQFSYEYLLEGIFDQGYTVIAVPYTFSLDHIRTAFGLIDQRDRIRKALDLPCSSQAFPHFWIGHSVGCKIIALLEFLTDLKAETGIANEPSILLAPNVSDTQKTVPWPLGSLLDCVKQGVSPTRSQTQNLIKSRKDLYTLTHLISFNQDKIAGNLSGSLPGGNVENSDSYWFNEELKSRPGFQSFALNGTHIAPIGFQFGSCLLEAEPHEWIPRTPKFRQLSNSSPSTLQKLLKNVIHSLGVLRNGIPASSVKKIST